MGTKTPPSEAETTTQKPAAGKSSTPPSPPERHPGKKPEQAGGKFEDLQIRDRGNAR